MRSIRRRFKRLCLEICREYRLIGRIWKGEFPTPGKKVSLSLLERLVMSALIILRSLSLVHLKDLAWKYKTRSAFSEAYVVLWLAILVLLLLMSPSLSPLLISVLVCYRIVDGVNYRLCILFVDRYKPDWGLRSLNRTLILLVLNFLEVVVGFAILFRLSGGVVNDAGIALPDGSSSIYFSLVTVTTLGFGDFHPKNTLTQWLTVWETLTGFVLVVLVIGAFLTGLKDVKEKDVKELISGL